MSYLSHVLSIPLIVFIFELIFKYFRSDMIMYLNVFINYLSNINCKFVIRFGYHDNLLKKMIYSNN